MRILTLCDEDQLLTLAAAARLLPRRRGDRPTHPSCLARWALKGCRGVYLPVLKVGATMCTTRSALFDFLAESTRQTGEPVIGETQSARREDAIVDSRLRAMGLVPDRIDTRGPRAASASARSDSGPTIPTRGNARRKT